MRARRRESPSPRLFRACLRRDLFNTFFRACCPSTRARERVTASTNITHNGRRAPAGPRPRDQKFNSIQFNPMSRFNRADEKWGTSCGRGGPRYQQRDSEPDAADKRRSCGAHHKGLDARPSEGLDVDR